MDKGAPKDPSNFPFYVFGNKKDKENERKVSSDKGKEWANRNSVPWEETSALDSQCIERAFEKIAQSMLKSALSA